MAPVPPHQAAPRGVIGWMVDFRVTFLPKVSCVRFLKYEAFCQVLCISALLALVPRCLAPTLIYVCPPAARAQQGRRGASYLLLQPVCQATAPGAS